MTFNSANHDSEIWEVNIEIHNTTCTILTKQKKETTTTLDMVEGKIELRDQLRDYEYRGDLHSNYNFLDFIINTYEDKSLPEPQVDTSRKVGRPQNRRIPYLPAAGKPKRCRVERLKGHETLPRIVGRWFTRNDDPQQAEVYAASMLLLLKPWRDLRELKSPTISFEDTFKTFKQSGNKRELQILDNIQYYHECWDVAQARCDAYRRGEKLPIFDYKREPNSELFPGAIGDGLDEEENDDLEHAEQPFWIPKEVTKVMIEQARAKQRAEKDTAFAEKAMAIAKACNIFPNVDNHLNQARQAMTVATRATEEDLGVINIWEKALQDFTRRQISERGVVDFSTVAGERHGNRVELEPVIESYQVRADTAQSKGAGKDANTNEGKTSIIREKLSKLNADQRRAHDIIEKRVIASGTHHFLHIKHLYIDCL